MSIKIYKDILSDMLSKDFQNRSGNQYQHPKYTLNDPDINKILGYLKDEGLIDAEIRNNKFGTYYFPIRVTSNGGKLYNKLKKPAFINKLNELDKDWGERASFQLLIALAGLAAN